MARLVVSNNFKVRPDAYDLYVFYDDTKPRFHTYMQMSEAMLHYVRKGQRVVGIYYGHPGVFVLSTHRAIAIARREGHEAVMKPGISALDCLCADLGVDPAYPGMSTFEASEVLLRKRPLDTTVHVVLWQVGLIGEQGYRRKGFINDKFPVLVEYLQEYYGEDYEVTHYVGARHATFEPTIAVYKLSEMLDPRVRATFTGISTFYIPPKDAAQTDLEMAKRLGFVPKPGQRLAQLSPARGIAHYGPRELAAIEEFEHFRVPHEYQYQPRTRAGEFLVELTQNVPLQDLYRKSPGEAVSESSFPGLSPLERRLLATHNENYAHVAAKGSIASHSPNERFILDMHREMALGVTRGTRAGSTTST
ncbi:MAG: SAM-dependent methyltransferase [Pyrinomonadaceae bacterium]